MKTKIKEAIEDIYSLFKKPPKLNVKSVKQHIIDFADKPDHFFTSEWSDGSINNMPLTKLRASINYVIGKEKCTFCSRSAADVQQSLINNWYKEEYQISALCGHCQDEVFIGAPDLREEVK
jgi:hypothetical protein